MACVAAMREAGLSETFHAAAGLSLGEYSALVMAGALAFADALRLVEKRGRFMAEACETDPGVMVSVIGLDDGIVEAICAEARQDAMVVAANYNSPGQVVISGTRNGVDRACELAKAHKAKRLIPLAVSGAFHSPLMEPAAARLGELLEATGFGVPQLTVVANVTARPQESAEEIRRNLGAQVRSAVRWTQTIQWLVGEGCDRFVETAPGAVLTGLVRRIAPEIERVNLATADALRAAAAG